MDQNTITIVNTLGVVVSMLISTYGLFDNYRKAGRSDLESDYKRVKEERDILLKEKEEWEAKEIEYLKNLAKQYKKEK